MIGTMREMTIIIFSILFIVFGKIKLKTRLSFAIIDKSIKELRCIFKVHPEWFETPKQKSDKGKNIIEYSII